MFEGDIYAGLVRDAANFLGDLLLVMIDEMVGPELFGFRELVLIAGGGDDLSAEHLGDLNGGGADAGTSTEYEDGVAGLDFGARDQHVPCGDEDERNRGGFFKRHRVRDGNDIDAGDGDELGVAAVVGVSEDAELAAEVLLTGGALLAVSAEGHGGEQNALPDLQVADVIAELGDLAGDVAAVNVGKLMPGRPLRIQRSR